MTRKEIETLYDYDEWATIRVLDVLEPLSEEQFTKDLGSSHGGIHGTVVHMFGADWIWFERWKGNSPTTLVTPEHLPTRQALRERWQDHFKDLKRFISTLDDGKLLKPHSYKDMKGNPYTQPLYHQMQHKVNHSSYHRGQIVALVRQVGAKAQSTDLINYYRILQK
ncbi:MAG: DinB family protein [Ignavibacteriales bacterium]|nr:DinB family protein [Ignavibacteriales bacterium]